MAMTIFSRFIILPFRQGCMISSFCKLGVKATLLRVDVGCWFIFRAKSSTYDFGSGLVYKGIVLRLDIGICCNLVITED
uniref:Uncharacterized protein n=1 Tax=Aegilops tauschii subsp. strangulata TaxID=200361 RepID=A0A453I2Z4_AEGTS